MMPEEIKDDEDLLRRFPPNLLNSDGSLSSSAYKTNGEPDNEISVHLARLVDPEEVLRRASRPTFGVGSIVARCPRDLGFSVYHDPLPEDDSHSLIAGQNSRAKCRILAEKTKVVRFPRSTSPRP